MFQVVSPSAAAPPAAVETADLDMVGLTMDDEGEEAVKAAVAEVEKAVEHSLAIAACNWMLSEELGPKGMVRASALSQASPRVPSIRRGCGSASLSECPARPPTSSATLLSALGAACRRSECHGDDAGPRQV